MTFYGTVDRSWIVLCSLIPRVSKGYVPKQITDILPTPKIKELIVIAGRLHHCHKTVVFQKMGLTDPYIPFCTESDNWWSQLGKDVMRLRFTPALFQRYVYFSKAKKQFVKN